MNKLLEFSLVLAANLMLVASFQNETIFKDSDIYSRLPPPLPLSGFNMSKICGLSSFSKNDDKLGELFGIDLCCRAHLECEDIMKPLSSLHSLFNPSILPVYNCSCEQKFLDCLHDVRDIPSSLFGQAYFGVMTQCFAKNHPVVGCSEYQEGRFSRRCIKYELDEDKEKEWQFFDLPLYAIKCQ